MKQADLQSSIIAHRNDRMGARIISMLNAIRIARDYDIPWFCGWTTGGRTHEECRDPTYIFSEDFVARKFFDGDLLHKVYNDLIDVSTVEGSNATRGQFLKPLKKGESYLAGAAMGITVLPWEDAAKVRAALPQCMDEFEYSPPVQAMIGEIKEMFAGSSLTAFHIRRGDIIYNQVTSNKLWPNKYIPREFYEVLLERLLEDPTQRILVFSDTPQEVERLKEKSDRVMGISDLFGERDFTSGARDFLELYAMSLCKQIYGPPSSAYSQTAMTIGGCRLQAVQDALTKEEHDIAMERMSQRLEQKSDLFINMGDVGQSLHFQIEYQLSRNDPARAKRIISAYMEDGLDKSFAYQLLCELSVTSQDLGYVEEVRKMAYARPVYVDDSIAVVNAYSGMNQLVKGDHAAARSRLQAATWFRPLEPLVQGALSTALAVGAITPENFYPFDPELVRRKAGVFPVGKPSLAALNRIVPHGMKPDERPLFHPWEIVVRDFRLVSGKRLNRAFTNISKIAKTRDMLRRSFAKMKDSPALISALGVYDHAMGDTQAALNAHLTAVEEATENPLYYKRLSDILFETGTAEDALPYLERATELSGNHPCYAACLADRLWLDKDRRDEARAIHDQLAASDHEFVEIRILTANMLRRTADRLPEALAELDKAEVLAHGAARIMTPKARFLMGAGRTDEAFEIYGKIVDWGLETIHTLQDMYRQCDRIGRPEVARDLIKRSTFDTDMVLDLVK